MPRGRSCSIKAGRSDTVRLGSTIVLPIVHHDHPAIQVTTSTHNRSPTSVSANDVACTVGIQAEVTTAEVALNGEQ